MIALPARSTPVDFAYAIHTEVGHRCIGARVNGRLVPLDTGLSSADTVEIFTSKAATAGPSRDWLEIVASSRARNKIRQWFSRERREDAIETGREELAKALRREGMPLQKVMASSALLEVARSMNLADLDALYAAIGEGQISAQSIVQRLARELRGGEAEQLPTTAARGVRRPRPGGARPPGSTSRGSTTSWSTWPGAAPRCPATRSWGSSPRAGGSRCTGPTAPTPPRSPGAPRSG